jgi:hypothetical protein
LHPGLVAGDAWWKNLTLGTHSRTTWTRHVIVWEAAAPPARRDVFRGDGDCLEARVRRGRRAQGLEADLLQGVREEPALDLNPGLGGAFAGLEFVRGGFAAVDEGFVVDDRGVESCDEVEEVVSPSRTSVKKSGSSVARARSSSRSVCLASSS